MVSFPLFHLIALYVCWMICCRQGNIKFTKMNWHQFHSFSERLEFLSFHGNLIHVSTQKKCTKTHKRKGCTGTQYTVHTVQWHRYSQIRRDEYIFQHQHTKYNRIRCSVALIRFVNIKVPKILHLVVKRCVWSSQTLTLHPKCLINKELENWFWGFI